MSEVADDSGYQMDGIGETGRSCGAPCQSNVSAWSYDVSMMGSGAGMRSIQTYILRLVMDEEAPNRLVGRLASFGEEKTFLFSDDQGLLAALRKLRRDASEDTGDKR